MFAQSQCEPVHEALWWGADEKSEEENNEAQIDLKHLLTALYLIQYVHFEDIMLLLFSTEPK